MGFTGVDREVAEKARTKKPNCGACNIHVCIYAITSDLISQPKNQALEENQWITDLAVNNVLDNLVGDDGDDWGAGQTG